MKFICCISICLVANIGVLAQYLTNPSFEGTPTLHVPPPSWEACHEFSTPDTQPGYMDIYNEPSEGSSYMGMVTRGDIGPYAYTVEDVQTFLLQPLLQNHCYSINIDLCMSNSAGHTTWAYGWVSYANPVVLRIYGSNESCVKTELLFESTAI